MIYDLRTYTLKPGSVPEYEKFFGEALAVREQYSRLGGFWHTEVGILNQVIHIWPYADMGERERLRVEGGKDPNWPPKVSHLLETMQSEIFTPLPFTPTMASGDLGPVFEWREYMMRADGQPALVENWASAIEERVKMSPLVMAMVTECGVLNKFVHIWGYESLEHRREVREEARAKGIWPPKNVSGKPDPILTQECKICFAAEYSPLK
jgi:hypothetical protein